MLKKTLQISFIYAVFWPSLLWAEVSKAISKQSFSSPEPVSMGGVMNMLLGLVVVIALILGLAWLMRKYGRLPMSNQVDMKVLGGLSLGTREKAVLVQVEGRRLLLGVSPGHVTTLHVLDDNGAAGFDDQLNQAIEQQQ